MMPLTGLPGVLAQASSDDVAPIVRPGVDWLGLSPLLVLVGGALVLMLVAAFVRRRPPTVLYTLWTCAVALGTVGVSIPLWFQVQDSDEGPSSTLDGAVLVDGFAVFAIVVMALAVLVATLLVDGYLRREGLEGVEAYVLLLFSASGGVVMAQANDLIVLFVGLEVLSIAVYTLAAMHARRVTSQEAGMKYFVLGAFSSAFFLYGIALTYGATGTTNLGRIMALFSGAQDAEGATVLSASVLSEDALVLAGLALMLVGLGFKVSAVPFQFWTPDVYQGAPSPIVAWMASGVKVAGFVGLMRVFMMAFDAYQVDWQPLIFGLAVATLLVGSILAVVQTNVKRMLAYSSIAHAGFILVAVETATDQGVESALFYLAVYSFMVAGSFGVVTLVGRTGDGRHELSDYAGLGRSRPVLALVLAIFLFAQAGVPPTAGFFAKFYVIMASVDAGPPYLAVVAMLSAVIAAFLYLRIVVSMYMVGDAADGAEGAAGEVAGPRIAIPAGAVVALTLCLVATLGVGVWPSAVVDLTRDAVPQLVVLG